jgi:hypothetical protein
MKAEYKDVINYHDGLNQDIIKVLESNFLKAKKQTQYFCEQFEAGNILDTCHNIWDFVKQNIPYKADGQAEQKIILPARMVERAEKGIGADCKSFALFCASNISNLYPNADVNFRYTCYRGSKTPSHVYCVVKTSRKIIKIDPVWHYFNQEKEYKHKIDHSMRIATLSGVNDKVTIDRFTYDMLKATKKAADAYPVGSKEYIYYVNQFKIVAKAAGLEDPAINGWLKDAAKKLEKGVKSAVNNVVAEVKKDIKKVLPTILRPLKFVKEQVLDKPEWATKLDYAKHLAKIAYPLYISMRESFFIVLALNYRDLCNRILQKNIEDPHSMERLWYKGFGGNPKALLDWCEKHKNKKAFFGKPKGIKGLSNFDGITIGEADTDMEPSNTPNSAGLAGSAGTLASSIAIAAGATGPQAAAIAAAVTMAFGVIGVFLTNLKKHPEDDTLEPPTPLPPGSPGSTAPGPEGSTYGPNGEIIPPPDAQGLFTTKNILIGGAALAALLIVPKLIKK